MISRELGSLGSIAVFDTTPIRPFFEASCSVHGRIKDKGASFLVSFNRYTLHCVACEI
jgi:hypothetical protein